MAIKVTESMINEWLPVTLSDLKTFKTPITDQTIKNSLYHRVIRDMYDNKNFLHHEEEYPKVGCYIKGYVRDVWEYLEDSYDLIHAMNFHTDPTKTTLDSK